MTLPAPAPDIDRDLVDALTRLMAEAAAIVRRSAARDVSLKPDGTPVTPADLAADACLVEGLARLMPGVPVVTEERAPPSPWRCPEVFVLVDPLDGTKEFIAGRDEYAINIAIVTNRRPTAGFIALPAFGSIYRGIAGRGAERLTVDDPAGALVAAPIRVRAAPAGPLVALASRSHRDAATEAFLRRLPAGECRHIGSALKFCRLAEGEADVYPRLAPTREWDIAAGHAIVAAAGGRMTGCDGTPLSYGNAERDFLVPGFIAWGDPALAG